MKTNQKASENRTTEKLVAASERIAELQEKAHDPSKPIAEIVLKDCLGVRKFLLDMGVTCFEWENRVFYDSDGISEHGRVLEFGILNEIHVQVAQWDRIHDLIRMLEKLCETMSESDMEVFKR